MCCSVVFAQLQDPLCRSCCFKLAKAESAPRSIIDVSGAFEQIQGFQASNFISEFWELAQGYKQTASDTHLGLPRTQNSNLQKTHPASHSGSVRGQLHAKTLEKAIPGIAKGMTRVEEMKDTKARGKRIKMIISLAVNNGKKHIYIYITAVPFFWLVKISRVHVSFRSPLYASSTIPRNLEDLPIYDFIGTVVSLVQEAPAKQFPKAAKIYRAAKYYCLSQSNLSKGTVSDLLLYYYNKRHITKIQCDVKSMELKFAVNHSALYPEDDDDSSRMSSALTRLKSTSRSSSRGNLTSQFSAASDDSASMSKKPPPNKRVSAWRTPTYAPVFARRPPTFRIAVLSCTM
ncbi:hypothetical protein DFH09DRAFT_1273648 [Mycena vulgaris]|nr:hypothetical protein DFH09DRAFT_1273648 [Mycena vulgaris]